MKDTNDMFSSVFSNMYEVKLDTDLQKYLVLPIGTEKQKDYAIICKNEFEAKNICAQIAMQMLESPEAAPLKYFSNGVHPNGHTRLYSLKG